MLWLFSVKAARAAAGLELKCIIMERGGARLGETVTYLLLSPRELAFYLLVLVKQSLVFSTQSCEARNQLLGKHCDVALSVVSHSAVSTGMKYLNAIVRVEKSGEPSLDDAAIRVAAGKNERWMEARQGLHPLLVGSNGSACATLSHRYQPLTSERTPMAGCMGGASGRTAP